MGEVLPDQLKQLSISACTEYEECRSDAEKQVVHQFYEAWRQDAPSRPKQRCQAQNKSQIACIKERSISRRRPQSEHTMAEGHPDSKVSPDCCLIPKEKL